MDGQGVLREIVALLAAGDVAGAASRCQARLGSDPGDVNLVALLGAIRLQQGEVADAERLLRRAITLAPDFAKPHEDLGALCLQQDRPAEAVECYRHAARLDPAAAGAYLGLATALSRCGRHAQAAQARQRFLEHSPTARMLTEAAGLCDGGELERAAELCGEILIREPANTRAMCLLARVSSARGRHAAAEALLRRVLGIAPQYWLGHRDLARLLAEQSRFHEAVDCYREAMAHNARDAGLPLELADTLALLGRAREALAAYQACLALDPERVPALLGCAHMLRILGRRADALAAYRGAIERQPAAGDAWWSLATLQDGSFADQDRRTMRALLDADDIDSGARTSLCFALARDAEARGRYAEAWTFYRRGNAARRAEVSYDPVENEQQTDARIRLFDRDLLQHPAGARTDAPVPVFIVGLPRSGSTLIEQILASHGDVSGCGELPYVTMMAARLAAEHAGESEYRAALAALTPDELRALGDEYLQLTSHHRPAAARWFTDKMPANFAHIGLIHLMLPQAIIIDARRNALDTCLANYRQLFAQGKNHSYDLQELGEYYLQYERLMKHWDEVLPGRVLRVRYEDVVNDVEAEVRRLLAHCGLPFEAACLDFHRSERAVNTASSEQVRRPIYSSAVGYWHHYAAELDDLREILESGTGAAGNAVPPVAG